MQKSERTCRTEETAGGTTRTELAEPTHAGWEVSMATNLSWMVLTEVLRRQQLRRPDLALHVLLGFLQEAALAGVHED